MSDDPKCPGCGKSSCVPCRALVAAEHAHSLISAVCRDADNPAMLSELQCLVGIVVGELLLLGEGRSELCDKHALVKL